MDHLRAEGIQRLVLESTSDYWRIWYYLAEAAGLEVWLVNARDVKHLPGRGKSDTADCVWLCKLNERGMLRRSFVPPQPVRDLRALTRTWSRLAQDQARHQARVEKILEDAPLKISVVISDLFGASGRRFLDALVAGERSPAALAALGDKRLRATRAELAEALTGRFRDMPYFRDLGAPAADRRDLRRDHRPGRADRAASAICPGHRPGLLRMRPAQAAAAPPAATTWPPSSSGLLTGWTRSPGSVPSTPGCSSPSSAPTPPSSPRPTTRRMGTADAPQPAVRVRAHVRVLIEPRGEQEPVTDTQQRDQRRRRRGRHQPAWTGPPLASRGATGPCPCHRNDRYALLISPHLPSALSLNLP